MILLCDESFTTIALRHKTGRTVRSHAGRCRNNLTTQWLDSLIMRENGCRKCCEERQIEWWPEVESNHRHEDFQEQQSIFKCN
jgi:hypothetical protein